MPGCLPDFSTWGSEHPLQRSPCPAPASPRSSPLTPPWCPHTSTCCLGHTGGRLRLRFPHCMSETGTSAHTTHAPKAYTLPTPIFLQWHLPWNTSPKVESICTSYFSLLLSFSLVYWTLSSILLSPLKCKFGEFPGSPMQWLCTLTSVFNDFGFHCRGSEFNPWTWGSRNDKLCGVANFNK